MRQVRLVFPYLLAKGAVEAGTVVTNLKYPNQGKYKSKDLDISIENGNLLQTASEGFSDVQSKDQGAGLSVMLSRVFKSKFDANSGSDLSLQTKKLLTYQLDNSNETFQALCQDIDFQMWFEEAVKLDNVYFVVGLQIIADADIDLTSESGIEGEAGSSIETGQPGVNLQACVEGHDKNARGTTFKALNEQIWAVEYRKVVFRSIRRKDIDSALLSSKQVWKSYLKTRGDDGEKWTHVDLGDVDFDNGEETFEVLKNDDNLVILVDPDSMKLDST